MKRIAPVVFLVSAAGCSSITHELQPHRLWRWNYQEAPSRTDDALFSIDDPRIPAMTGEKDPVVDAERTTASTDSTKHE